MLPFRAEANLRADPFPCGNNLDAWQATRQGRPKTLVRLQCLTEYREETVSPYWLRRSRRVVHRLPGIPRLFLRRTREASPRLSWTSAPLQGLNSQVYRRA